MNGRVDRSADVGEGEGEAGAIGLDDALAEGLVVGGELEALAGAVCVGVLPQPATTLVAISSWTASRARTCGAIARAYQTRATTSPVGRYSVGGGRTSGKEGPISIDLLAPGFWVGLLVPLVGYVVYPIAALISGRFAHDRVHADGPWPSVTVAIAAHNEEATIVRAVRSVLDQAYGGPPVRVVVGLDGCTDRTGEALATLPDRNVAVLELPRAGKAPTDNRLVAAATTDVVVTTSAGAEFAAGSLAKLISPLRDAQVGCTTGVFRPRPNGGAAADGERAYWGLENRVMDAESRLGSLAMASGTALAFRRSLFEPIPAGSDADVTVAPMVVLHGERVVHVPDAIVYDDGPSSLRMVFRSRRRMTLRALPATLALIPRLARTGHGRAALALLCHKVCRWLTPFALAISGLACIALVLRDGVTNHPVELGIVLLAAVAMAVGLLLRRTRGAMTSLAVAQAAFTLGTLDALRGRRAATWSRDGG